MRKNFNLVWQNLSEHQVKKPIKNLPNSEGAYIKRIIERGNQLKDQTIVIKLSSLIIQDEELLTNFAKNISIISECGARIVIVHDYVGLIESSLQLLQVDPQAIMDIKSLDYQGTRIIEMILSGYINKHIVSKLCEVGCNAIGISGKDCNLIRAKRFKALHKREYNESVIDIGFVCEPIVVNPEVLLNFEDIDVVPVISPIAYDEYKRTNVLDVNLTSVVISNAIGADHLLFFCDKEIATQSNLRVCDPKTLKNIKAGCIDSSLHSLFEVASNSLEQNSNCVHFISSTLLDGILLTFFSDIEAEDGIEG